MFQDRSPAFSIVSKGREREILRFYRENYSNERKKGSHSTDSRKTSRDKLEEGEREKKGKSAGEI